ncbi:glycosyltransferase 87 family protein [Nocardioides sp.]|uniref:glycosyltransferase 87 family protein n=1 Tax=Nocardioides sp. TaxID=35761 RepID=UPI003D0AF2FC
MGDASEPKVVSRGLLSGPAPVVAVVVAAAVAGGLSPGFTDLYVYLQAGRSVLDGLPVEHPVDPVTGLSFTYPPFAALVMVPLALVPGCLAAAFVTGASVAALAATVRVVRIALARPAPGWLVALVTVGALALEPVWQNLTFGQVNLVLMLAVVLDLLRPDRRWCGVLIGIAAAVKLTPLVFVLLLLLVGRRTAAGRAVLVFAGSVAIGFALMPGWAASYWSHGLFDARRVGPPGLAHNQSIYGVLTRLLDGPPPTLLWLAVAAPLAAAILVLGAWWWRHGDRVLGTCLGAVAMLLASPVSWSHHWVWAAPIALLLWERARWACVLWGVVFVARPIVWPPYGRGREAAWSPLEHVAGNAYVLAALALCIWAARRATSGPALRGLGARGRTPGADPLAS